MSRLYYEQPVGASAAQGASGRSATERSGGAGRFLEKVAKLVPSEIVAGYLVLIGFVPLVRAESWKPWIHAAVFLLCLVLTPIYLNRQAEPGKPKRTHLIVSTCAFVVWAYATSGALVVGPYYDPAVASIALVGFTLVSGAIRLR